MMMMKLDPTDSSFLFTVDSEGAAGSVNSFLSPVFYKLNVSSFLLFLDIFTRFYVCTVIKCHHVTQLYIYPYFYDVTDTFYLLCSFSYFKHKPADK